MDPGPSLLVAVAVATAIAGVVIAINGLRRVPAAAAVPPRRRARSRRVARLRLLLLVGLGLGMVVWLVTGWVLAVVLGPAALAGLPWLLSNPNVVSIARLEGMEEWTRGLAGVLTVGVGLEQAILATQSSAPAPIRPDVDRLASRIRARWATAEALRAFADDLDDATGDLIASSLVLASQRRGRGLAALLNSLADTAADEVRMRRLIEAERARPRATARWITIITTGALVVLSFAGDFMAPYASGPGQVVLLVLLGVFGAGLVWLRAMTAGDPLPRFMGADLRERDASGEARQVAS